MRVCNILMSWNYAKHYIYIVKLFHLSNLTYGIHNRSGGDGFG